MLEGLAMTDSCFLNTFFNQAVVIQPRLDLL